MTDQLKERREYIRSAVGASEKHGPISIPVPGEWIDSDPHRTAIAAQMLQRSWRFSQEKLSTYPSPESLVESRPFPEPHIRVVDASSDTRLVLHQISNTVDTWYQFGVDRFLDTYKDGNYLNAFRRHIWDGIRAKKVSTFSATDHSDVISLFLANGRDFHKSLTEASCAIAERDVLKLTQEKDTEQLLDMHRQIFRDTIKNNRAALYYGREEIRDISRVLYSTYHIDYDENVAVFSSGSQENGYRIPCRADGVGCPAAYARIDGGTPYYKIPEELYERLMEMYYYPALAKKIVAKRKREALFSAVKRIFKLGGAN
jgi:hypothetical protein